MPPSIPKSSLSSLARCQSAKPSPSLPFRTFSTTPSRAVIGPENPKFIEVPVAPQQQAPERRIIKGALPVPRNIFRKRGTDVLKTSPKYLTSATLEPTDPKETSNEYLAWKRRLAATRRESLREGLVELEKRKKVQDAVVATQSRTKSLLREERVNAKQREDERLTNPTISSATRTLQTGVLPDPQRAQRVAEKAARVEAKQREKEEERRDALHTLYMNARSFITTEDQLAQRVEELFTDTPHEPNNKNQNIWDMSTPPTVERMLSAAHSKNKKAVFYGHGPAATTLKRMKKIAEELTGGKMDIPTDEMKGPVGRNY